MTFKVTRDQHCIVNIPFGGFYHSKWDDLLEREIESEIDYFNERENESQGEDCPYKVTTENTDIGSILFDCMDHSDAYFKIAQDYVDSFNQYLKDELDLDLSMSWESMSSPSEYNFTTDRLFCYISESKVKALFDESAKDDHDTLAGVIKERFTSYDGFMSFYKNDLESWLEKPLSDWDHNELGTLLIAVMELRGIDPDYDWAIYENLADYSYEYLDCALDWEKYTEKVSERRAELLEEWRADNPNEEYSPRCTETFDLFTSY